MNTTDNNAPTTTPTPNPPPKRPSRLEYLKAKAHAAEEKKLTQTKERAQKAKLKQKIKRQEIRGRRKRARQELELTKLRKDLFSSLTHTLNRISEDKNIIFLYLEHFLNARPQTKENLSLAYLYYIFSQLTPEEREQVTYEELLRRVYDESLERHAVDPTYLIAAVSGGAALCNTQVAHAIAALETPEVVKAVIREATKSEGSSYQDRKLLLEITGVVSKDPSVVVNNNLTNQTANIHVDSQERGIPNFIGDISGNDKLFRENYRKVLQAAKEEEIIDLAREDIVVEKVD